MSRFSDWRASRRVAQEQAVLRAIGMLRPSKASAYPISRLARMGSGKVYVVLLRLEKRGEVIREAIATPGGPFPRRWVYRVAKAEVRS